MKQSFLAHGFFLAEHTVYEKLAQELILSFENKTPQRWSVVCERKEDLLSIRTQIFSLLKQTYKNRHPDSDLTAWAGVSLYTPDSLVRNFALTLSHNTPEQVGRQAHALFSSPFLDIVEQERLTRLLLLKLGYSGSDVAPLAKQILTLADTPLPADESFLSLLIEVQKLGDSFKKITDIPDVSLRTICVAYQLIQQINSHYCRLQSFVQDYLQPDFISHLRSSLEQTSPFENFLLPKRFLAEPLLWVAAPEYARAAQEKGDQRSYRPGNFQAYWTDTLRDVLFEAREVYQKHSVTQAPSSTWWARTVIDAQLHAPKSPSADVHVLNSQAALEHRFDQLINTAGAERQFILGDLDSKIWNIGRTDGSGVHSLTPANFAQFLKEKETVIDEGNFKNGSTAEVLQKPLDWENHPLRRIDTLHNEFSTDWKRIEKFSSLIHKALSQYELSPSLRKHGIDFNLLLHRFFDSENFTVGHLGAIGQLPPALSLLPSMSQLKEIFVFGVPHSPTQPSFHLRILNAVFYHLRSKQIPLDPIASEVAYRGYWQSILSRSEKISFNLRSFSEIQKFPDYSVQWCLPPVSWNHPNDHRNKESHFETWLNHQNQIEDLNWTKLLPNAQTSNSTTLAVTAFESYVECPLKFYWLNLHNAESIHSPAFRANQLQLGHKAHAMAERFLQSLRHIILLSEYNQDNDVLSHWSMLTEHINSYFILTDDFMSVSMSRWQQSLVDCLEKLELNQAQKEHAKNMAEQLTQIIFKDDLVHKNQSHLTPELEQLQQQLTREGVRRAFRKLIQTEAKLSESQVSAHRNREKLYRKAAFLEQPVVYQLTQQLRLAGRIDRVDTTPEGDEIIDYKTSKVPKNDPALVLLPHHLNTTNRLSVQGAIYSLAWAHMQKEDDERDTRGVKAFSLFRLKTLNLERNPVLSYTFETPLMRKSELFDSIHSVYEPFADALTSGLFPAQPVIKDVCKSCSLSPFCPTGRNQFGVNI